MLSDLVKALPEIYQPIFGHPELSQNASRRCEDRLSTITCIYRSLEAEMGRPLRVLDIGCAQGFFSHALSGIGAQVRGIDVLEANIAVCQALAKERDDNEIVFEVARIEDLLPALAPGSCDLVLGLSVFHHLVHAHGTASVRALLHKLSDRASAAVFELARDDEPMNWAVAQPKSPRELLSDFAFIHEVARHDTHLSPIKRPIYFASNHYWYLDGHAGCFTTWTASSNCITGDTNGKARRFYFDDKRLIKTYCLDELKNSELALEEWAQETAVLRDPPAGFATPRLEVSGRNESEAWLVRELLPGKTLAEHLTCGRPRYEPERTLREVLTQVVALEAAGFYHNDIRSWNVLIGPDGNASLIDYGAISKNRVDCAWPNNIFLSFLIFMRETLEAKIEFPIPVRSAWLNPDGLPEPYRGAVWGMLQYPIISWRFSTLLEAINSGQKDPPRFHASVDRHTAASFFQALETSGDLSRHHIVWLEGELATEREARTRLEQDISAEREALASLDQQINAEREARSRLEQELSAERKARIDLEGDLSVEREARGELEREISAAREACRSLEQDIQSIRLSMSWRATVPLRAAARALRAVFCL